MGRERILSESLSRVAQSFPRDAERAQKHVTKRISCWADSRAGRIVEVYRSRALPAVKESAGKVSTGLRRVEGSLPQKWSLLSSIPSLAVKASKHAKDSMRRLCGGGPWHRCGCGRASPYRLLGHRMVYLDNTLKHRARAPKQPRKGALRAFRYKVVIRKRFLACLGLLMQCILLVH